MRILANAIALVIGVSTICCAQEQAQSRAGDQPKVAALRAGIEDLMVTFGPRYKGGEGYLAELAKIEGKLATEVERAGALVAFEDLQRRALVANPLISGRPILYVERRQYPGDHHNTGNIFQTGEINTGKFKRMAGGSIKTVDLASGETKTVLSSAKGLPRDPELRFDGERIVFSMRNDPADDYHVYEMATDGTDLKQLTQTAGVSDLDPFYLACGDIAFSSTREPKYCTCNRHIMANLFRMEPDGANILQIGKSIEYEGHGIQLPDGRLLYFRWEYVDRNFGGGQGLWVSNPDGTNHAIYYGQSTPHAVINARPIPNSDKLICILSSCHDRPWGALAILDRKLGIEGKKPITRIWPESARELIADETKNYGGSRGFDNFKRVKLKYEDPFALSDKHFLVSRMIAAGSEDTGIYLVDTFGNEVLLHRAGKGQGCYDPMPIAASKRPRRVPTRRDYNGDVGTFYVADVYEGTHMKDVAADTVKYLRVVENPPKLTWTHPGWGGQGQEAPAMNWHDFDNKRIIGTVPVEEDGSAYFEVPSDRFVYFQLLDSEQRMVQSMRSGVIVQSGETNSCIGCHEDRDRTPRPTHIASMALEKGARKLQDWLGPERHFSFMAEVQPVFTKNCVQCHDYGKDAGEKLNLAPDRTLVFNTAYMDLHAKKLIKTVGGGPNRIMEAYSWGANASRLMKVLDVDHYGVELSDEEKLRLSTWIDLNAPYYPTYASAYDKGVAGRAPLGGAELKRLEKLTGKKVRVAHGALPMISFDRPPLSPILRGLKQKDEKALAQALAIIVSGKTRLESKPRADMPGFVPCETDQVRLQKYERLREHQERVRAALRAGKKVYDHDQVK